MCIDTRLHYISFAVSKYTAHRLIITDNQSLDEQLTLQRLEWNLTTGGLTGAPLIEVRRCECLA